MSRSTGACSSAGESFPGVFLVNPALVAVLGQGSDHSSCFGCRSFSLEVCWVVVQHLGLGLSSSSALAFLSCCDSSWIKSIGY